MAFPQCDLPVERHARLNYLHLLNVRDAVRLHQTLLDVLHESLCEDRRNSVANLFLDLLLSEHVFQRKPLQASPLSIGKSSFSARVNLALSVCGHAF